MCKISPATIAADGAAVGKALNQIAAACQATNPTLASDLNLAASALVAATANWTTGTPTTDIETAANAILAVLSAIPETAPYAVFVGIAVDALELLIANASTQNKQTGTDQVKDALVVRTALLAPEPNPWTGVVTIKRHPFESYPNAIRRYWNNGVDETQLPEFSKL